MEREPQPKILGLGFAPASGSDSVTQCTFFKALMWQKIGRNHEGAHLATVAEGNRRGMAVEYYEDVPGAENYARRAKEEAEEVWKEVTTTRHAERSAAR